MDEFYCGISEKSIGINGYSEGARLFRLSWADENGVLSEYTPVKLFYSETGRLNYQLTNIEIPDNAVHISCSAYDNGLNKISENNVKINKVNTDFSSERCLRIAAVSDIHTVCKGKSRKLLGSALFDIRDKKADFVLSAGDITNGCQQDEYEIVENSVNKNLCGTAFFTALGNHDYFANHHGDIHSPDARNAFIEKIRNQAEDVHYYKNCEYSVRIFGIQVILLDCIQNSENFFIDDEQLSWLKNELSLSSTERFRIIVNHLPLAAHCLGSK